MVEQVVGLGAEREPIAFFRQLEELADGRILIPVVEAAHDAAVSDHSRVTGNKVSANVGIGEQARDTGLIELQSVRRNGAYPWSKHAERRYVVVGVVLVGAGAIDRIAGMES